MADDMVVPGIPRDLVSEIQQKEEEQKKEEMLTVTNLDDVSFVSWGYTPYLKVTHGSEVKRIRLPIKSVGISEIMEEYQLKVPKPPVMMEMYKADSEVARTLNRGKPIVVKTINEADPKYLDERARHESEASQMIMLLGLAMDIRDGGDLILEGKDTTVPSRLHDKDRALKKLRAAGFSSEHFGIILKAVRELTADANLQEDLE